MPSKYCHTQGTNSNYVDLTSICELQVHDAVPGFGETETTGVNFVGESFQKAGTNTQNIVLAGYNVNGSSATFVKKGCYPTCSKSIWSSTTPGQYQINRTDTSLTIGSSTFYPADFRCNSIPHELIILTVGAGGGGGGNGYFSPGKDKSGYVKVSGGAGGGGAQAIGRLKISNDYTYYVAVGTGGAAGSDGSSGAKSTGANGSAGDGSSVFFQSGSYKLLWGAGGGAGGTGGIGGEDAGTAGTGGAGGTAHFIADFNQDNIHYLNTNSCSGGTGNYYQSHNNTGSAGLTYLPTSGTGATEVTISDSRNNNAATENKDDGSNSYFSGGCSYGWGSYFSNGAATTGGSGGGGTAGITVSAGNNGKVEIWY